MESWKWVVRLFVCGYLGHSEEQYLYFEDHSQNEESLVQEPFKFVNI